MAPEALRRIYNEIGLGVVVKSPRDTKILCLQRIVRFLAYGSTSLVLALFLSSLDVSDEKIGLFMTLTLLGDVVISLVLTIIADGIGRRRMLMFGASMMVASGIVFALSSNYWILVAASVFGVISPRSVCPPYASVRPDCVAVETRSVRSEPLKNLRLCTYLLRPTERVYLLGTLSSASRVHQPAF